MKLFTLLFTLILIGHPDTPAIRMTAHQCAGTYAKILFVGELHNPESIDQWGSIPLVLTIDPPYGRNTTAGIYPSLDGESGRILWQHSARWPEGTWHILKAELQGYPEIPVTGTPAIPTACNKIYYPLVTGE